MNILEGKVILFNSPPNTGKNLAADTLCAMTGAKHCEFKGTLFNIAIAITGLTHKEFFSIYNDRDKKEAPQEEFNGLSPREMLIWISEEVCKPKFDKLFFGVSAAKTLDIKNGSVFSDSGFPDEVFPLADRVGAENIYVVRFTRNGGTFEGDSRNFLQPEDCPKGVNFIDLVNDEDTIMPFLNRVIDEIEYTEMDKEFLRETFHAL